MKETKTIDLLLDYFGESSSFLKLFEVDRKHYSEPLQYTVNEQTRNRGRVKFTLEKQSVRNRSSGL